MYSRVFPDSCNFGVIEKLLRACYFQITLEIIQLAILNSLFRTCSDNLEQTVRTQLVNSLVSRFLETFLRMQIKTTVSESIRLLTNMNLPWVLHMGMQISSKIRNHHH